MCSGDWYQKTWGVACSKNECLWDWKFIYGWEYILCGLVTANIGFLYIVHSRCKCRFALSRISLYSSSSSISDAFACVFANENSTKINNHWLLQTQEDSARCKKRDWLCPDVFAIAFSTALLFLFVEIIKGEMIFLCLWKDLQWFLLLLVPSLRAWNVAHRGDVLLSSFLICYMSGGGICHIIINIPETRSLSQSGNSWRLLVPLSGGRSMV